MLGHRWSNLGQMSVPAERVKTRSKRDHGSGTLTEIEPKVWRLRATAGIDAATGKKGRQISRTIRVSKPANRGGKGEALDELRKLVAEVAEGKHVGTSANFETLSTQYLVHVKRTKELETYNSYRIKLEKNIVPTLGSIKLSALTAHDLDELYSRLENDGYAPTTIEHVHNVLSGALTQAIRWGWIDRNVAKLATPPKAVAKEREALSPAEIARLIQGAIEVERDPDLAVLIYLLCLVGGRRGEACGLQWGDVDWEHQAIRIERQIVPTAGGQRTKAPKGGKQRVEALGSAGVQILIGYQTTLRQRLGPDWIPTPEGWIVSPDGGTTALRVHGVTELVKRLGSRLLDEDGTPAPIDARPHDFRRFSATQLGIAGVDPRTIRDRLGHASITTTERYMLRVNASDVAAADVMGELLMSAAAFLSPNDVKRSLNEGRRGVE